MKPLQGYHRILFTQGIAALGPGLLMQPRRGLLFCR